MKKSILFIAIVFIATTIQAQKKIKGNGNMTSITRTTSDYDSVQCSGSFDFVLVAGIEGSIKIEGEENLMQYLITEVKDGNLIVRTEDRINLQFSKDKTIKITIPFKEISSVSLSGSGDLWNQDKIITDNMKVSLTGSGDVVLNVEATSTKASVAGSGDLILKGKTHSLNANVSGSGNLHGFELPAMKTEISVAGSGDAEVVCYESLKAQVAGSGDIRYKGNPKIEDSKVAGSGSISQEKK
ncbi:MAG: head GIN domain-containing protein [Aquaticitalea sp.]